MRKKSPRDSFRYAGEGILHTFRTQRNMRIHFVMLVLVLTSALLMGIELRDMLLLLFCTSLVIVTEMINTAVETVVDMITQTYHPLAKLAKDVAAGAVLVASMNAFVAGVLIFFQSDRLEIMRERSKIGSPPELPIVMVVGILVLVLTVMISKLLTGRSNRGLWHGGVVSGHSAIGFFLAMTILFLSDNKVVAILAVLLAMLVAQSRVEAGVHSIQEVIFGAVVAIFMTALIYWLMPMIRTRLMNTQLPSKHQSNVLFLKGGAESAFGVERNRNLAS